MSKDPRKSLPRGIRNNNPGNIRATRTLWKGLADPPSDGEFCRFTSAEYGLRALFLILFAYQRRGLVTVPSIIGTWAPPSENDTQTYIDRVLSGTGFSFSERIDVSDPRMAIPMARAIVAHENGPCPMGQWYPFDLYAAAHSTAASTIKKRVPNQKEKPS